jgi:Inositol monophosphatase family
MLGASAIDLAWTAEGRPDACIMLGNKPWDTSAGVLIAREAGARVLDHDGSEHSQESESTIAVKPALEADLMAAVQAALAEQGRPPIPEDTFAPRSLATPQRHGGALDTAPRQAGWANVLTLGGGLGVHQGLQHQGRCFTDVARPARRYRRR